MENHRKSRETHPTQSWEVRKVLSRLQWPALILSWVAALLMGYIGFQKSALAASVELSPFDLFYLTLQLIPMESGAVSGLVSWELEIARLLLPILAAYTLLRTLAFIFNEQVLRLRLNFFRDHTVICGLSLKGQLLAERLAEQGKKVVVIEKDPAHPAIHQCHELGIPVLVGDAADGGVLHKAGVSRASHLLAVCDQDGVNASIALSARQICLDSTTANLTCTVHIHEPHMYELLREAEFSGPDCPGFRLELFNVYERGARRLAHNNPLLDPTRNLPDKPPRILIVGLGRLGENLLVHLVRRWHSEKDSGNGRLQITAIDRNATSKVESLCIRYPYLMSVCEIHALPVDIHSAEFQRAAFLLDAGGSCSIDWIYVCLDNDSLGLQAALVLRQRMGSPSAPIVVRLSEHKGLADLMTKNGGRLGEPGCLQAFDLLEWACSPEWVLAGSHATLARALHEEYLHQQKASGKLTSSDPALVPWEDLPPSLQDANLLQASRLAGHLNRLGYSISPLFEWFPPFQTFTPDEVETLSQMEHESWMEKLLRDGWKHEPGPKDYARRKHPDLVPWDKLPETEKEKNRIAVRELPKSLGRAGFRIVRCD